MSLPGDVLARRMRLIEPETRDLQHERDLRVPMDDGVELLADRWVARAAADRPQPTVLVRSPYGRRQFPGLLFGRLLAERGLQVVVQSVRGTFGSGGEFSPFDERADGRATLRWIRAQAWHADAIGTIGPSYLGLVQWALAGDGADDLAAMAVAVSASQFYDQTYAGGSVSLETVASWLVIIATQERRLAPLAINHGLRMLRGELSDGPLSEIDRRAIGADVPWFREGTRHPARDEEYWTQRDFSATVPEVTAPVSFVGGWYDIFAPWMLDDFVTLQAAGRSPRLVMGPWTHTSPGLVAAGHREGIAWLRAHLLGDARLVRSGEPVALLITGDGGGWREYAAWPPPGGRETRLALRAAGGLGGEGAAPGGGGGAPGGGDRYRYDPADPTPSLGGPVLLERDPVVDNGPLEARRDVLTYTTAPLSEVVEAIGRPLVEVWVRASAPYFDVFARVCDVDADGVSRNVCDGLASVAPGRCERGEDGAWRVALTLWPLGHRFAAGHRIRLQLSSGAHPRFARNPGTGADRTTAAPETMRAVEIAVLRDGAHPSALVLPAR